MAAAADAGAEDAPLAPCLSAHSWNRDRTQLAISPNNNDVYIYQVDGTDPTKWVKTHTLKQHDAFVSGIDWSATTDQIVTCGHDRNAYVWKFENGAWTPVIVMLRINRAATAVKWSPDGNKFAVACGMKCVPVCTFQPANNWWGSKIIKKHKSTVLSLDWHKNNKILVTGCADKKCRVFSAYIDSLDNKDDTESVQGLVDSPEKLLEFGTLLAEFDCDGWVESVAWSPLGTHFAYAGHDSSLNLVFPSLSSPNAIVSQSLKLANLPYRKVAFLSQSTILAVGYDNNPHLFINAGTDAQPKWQFYDKLDKDDDAVLEKKREEKKAQSQSSTFSASMNIFKAQASKGIAIDNKKSQDAPPVPEVLPTRHQNTITEIYPFWDSDAAACTKFSTCSIDGRVLFWDLATVGVDLHAAKLA